MCDKDTNSEVKEHNIHNCLYVEHMHQTIGQFKLVITDTMYKIFRIYMRTFPSGIHTHLVVLISLSVRKNKGSVYVNLFMLKCLFNRVKPLQYSVSFLCCNFSLLSQVMVKIRLVSVKTFKSAGFLSTCPQSEACQWLHVVCL